MRSVSCLVLVLLAGVPLMAGAQQVLVQETDLEIPTYLMGPEDKNPPLDNLNVYPYPMQTEVTGRKTVRSYRAVVMENQYLRVIVLPELGGKIYAAHDRANHDADFIYHNHVVKPGLVALRGAWTSGGIEWNFPTRGHSVNTFSPVPYKVIRGDDGSATCVVGTVEWVRRMQWTVAITLFPDRSCFRNRICLYNPTLMHQNAYFWANAAVHAWDDTRVTFPPAEHTFAGMRRHPQPWPTRDGTDRSWYKNTPYPHDYFCGAPGDFQGAYHVEHDCGTVNCASRHDAMGRKFWTWGTAPGGRLWEKILTDSDGAYIEVQSGRLPTQGDTWIMDPHLQETFEDYWYPVRGMGGLVKANPEAAVNVERRSRGLLLAVNVTRRWADASLELLAGGKTLFQERATLDPAGSWRKEIPWTAEQTDYRFVVRDARGKEIIHFGSEPVKLPSYELEPEFPDRAQASVEELYLDGYYAMKHWRLAEAVGLFREALGRDPGFTPALRTMAMIECRSGFYREALDDCNRVLSRNDDDHMARYYRALANLQLGQTDRAEQDLAVVGRRAEYRHVAPYVLAALAVGRGDLAEAQRRLHESIRQNPGDLRARCMLAAVLRRRNRAAEGREVISGVLKENPIDPLATVEQAFLGAAPRRTSFQAGPSKQPEDGTGLEARPTKPDDLAVLRHDPQQYLEVACAYLEMNLVADAVAALELYRAQPGAAAHPFVCFYLGYLADRRRDVAAARDHYAQGIALPCDYVFPFRAESIEVLQTGLRLFPAEWKLRYYLGTLLAVRLRQEEAIAQFELAAQSDPSYSVLYRNQAELYREQGNREKAAAAYEKALRHDPNDYRYYAALDSLYADLGDNNRREALFGRLPESLRNDTRVLLSQATCHVDAGRCDAALEILRTHQFHPWEGWTGARDVYVRCLHARADQRMKAGRYEEAIDDLRQAMEYPENLGTGRPHQPVFVREHYKMALCYRALGKEDLARSHFRQAADSPRAASARAEPDEEESRLREAAIKELD